MLSKHVLSSAIQDGGNVRDVASVCSNQETFVSVSRANIHPIIRTKTAIALTLMLFFVNVSSLTPSQNVHQDLIRLRHRKRLSCPLIWMLRQKNWAACKICLFSLAEDRCMQLFCNKLCYAIQFEDREV